MLIDTTQFEEQLPILPQPVAMSVGRVVRARHLSEQLDAIVKAAEVLTRYVAIADLASFSYRVDPTVPLPDLGLAGKDLAFGDFLRVPQVISSIPVSH